MRTTRKRIGRGSAHAMCLEGWQVKRDDFSSTPFI
uniref:Uncharacterized protein n=1 Tax=virus sp. ctQiC1 TaxID=2825817 RepID=A0A8S5RMS0_9VIRU|nr:MAG TPA: hypothetical protein [virus sp. ctQiC1]